MKRTAAITGALHITATMLTACAGEDPECADLRDQIVAEDTSALTYAEIRAREEELKEEYRQGEVGFDEYFDLLDELGDERLRFEQLNREYNNDYNCDYDALKRELEIERGVQSYLDGQG